VHNGLGIQAPFNGGGLMPSGKISKFWRHCEILLAQSRALHYQVPYRIIAAKEVLFNPVGRVAIHE